MVDETTLTQEQLLDLQRTEAEEAQGLILQLIAKLRRLELRHPGLKLVDTVIDGTAFYEYLDELRGDSDEEDDEEDSED